GTRRRPHSCTLAAYFFVALFFGLQYSSLYSFVWCSHWHLRMQACHFLLRSGPSPRPQPASHCCHTESSGGRLGSWWVGTDSSLEDSARLAASGLGFVTGRCAGLGCSVPPSAVGEAKSKRLTR